MKIAVILAAAALALLPASAGAAIFQYAGAFSGANEAPPNASPATGTALVTIDDVANTMRVEFTFGGLIGNTTVAHLHCCAAPGANAGVATPTPSFPGFPAGVTAGAYDMTFDLTLASSYNAGFITNAGGGSVAGAMAALIAGLNSGQVYANIHTTFAPGGEIRANLSEVPLPAAFWLFLAGAAALAGRVRRA